MQNTRKKCGILIFTVVTLGLFTGVLFSIEDTVVLPKTGHRKPPIVFNHKAHAENYGAKCIDCHHTGKNSKCSNCHMNRDQGTIINLKGAFHQQCQGCHRKTSGPKGCGRCHQGAKR